jgi:hypothetical protein
MYNRNMSQRMKQKSKMRQVKDNEIIWIEERNLE